MNTIGIFEAKTHLSQICEQVHETHEPVLITRRGSPLVRIEPITSHSQHPSTIWECRETFIKRYGEFPELEIPARETDPDGSHLFDE